MGDPQLKPGDEVDVPWGLDTFSGAVVDTYISGGVRRVRVAVNVPDTEERQLITLPADAVSRSRKSHSEFAKPGAWLHAEQYEQALRIALTEAVQSVPELGAGTMAMTSQPADDGVDISFASTRFYIAVVVKWQLRDIYRFAIDLTKRLDAIEANSNRVMAALIVSPNTAGRSRSERSVGLIPVAPRIIYARWQGPEDDGRLIDAIHLALLG